MENSDEIKLQCYKNAYFESKKTSKISMNFLLINVGICLLVSVSFLAVKLLGGSDAISTFIQRII